MRGSSIGRERGGPIAASDPAPECSARRQACASRSSASAACRPTTAVSRRLPSSSAARLVERGHEVTVYGRDRWVAAAVRESSRDATSSGCRPRGPSTSRRSSTRFSPPFTCSAPATTSCTSATPRTCRRRCVLLLGPTARGAECRRTRMAAGEVERHRAAYYRVCAWVAAQPADRDRHRRAGDPGALPRRRTGARPTTSRMARTSSRSPDDGTLASLGLEPGRYVLYVSRLEPENNAHVVIEAYSRVDHRPPARHRRRRAVCLATTSRACTRRPTRASASSARSMAMDTASSARTRRSMSRRPKSAARIRPSSRRWASGTPSSPTTCRSTARRSATRAGTTAAATSWRSGLQLLLDDPAQREGRP